MNGAGTDAKVYLTMNGDKSKVAKHQLEKPDGGKNPFEKGNKDVFKFNEADVGKVIVINSDIQNNERLYLSSKRSTLNTMEQA